MAAEKVILAVSYDKTTVRAGETLRVTVTRSGWEPLAPWLYRTVYMSLNGGLLGADIDSILIDPAPKTQYNPSGTSGGAWGSMDFLQLFFWYGETSKTFTVKFKENIAPQQSREWVAFHITPPTESFNYTFDLSNSYSYVNFQAVLPSVTLAVSPTSVLEDGTTNLVYTFTRTGLTTNALTVNYGITGTAVADDYTGATPGTGKTITFASGSSTATLTIDPTADSTVESDETVALTLATATGYTVETTAVVGTITNDDTSLTLNNLPFVQSVFLLEANQVANRVGIYPYDTETSPDGSIYITGTASGGFNGNGSYGKLDGLSLKDSQDPFITKLASDGSKLWTRLQGSSLKDIGAALTIGLDGSLYSAGSTEQGYSGQSDIYVTRYSTDGTRDWTRYLFGQSGPYGTTNDFANSLCTGADGSIYVAG